jgi:hypothetical protein
VTTETLFIWRSIMATKEAEIEISQAEAQKMVKDYHGRQYFGVVFVKRTNHKDRTMNCRKGVAKGVRGGGLAFNPVDKGLVSVHDRNIGQYRFVSLDTIKRVSMRGKRYIVRA